jgi:hypothetical protein
MPLPKKSVAKKVPAKKTPAKKATPKKVAKKETEVEMKVFTCKACKQKFPDMGLYFYGNKSEKCMWCKKFPSRNTPKT